MSTFIQSNHAEAAGSGNSISTALTGVGQGNGILAGITFDDGTGSGPAQSVSTFVDDLSTNFVNRKTEDNTTIQQVLAAYDILNEVSGNRTFTVTYTSSQDFRGIAVEEVNGIVSFHDSSGAMGNGTNLDSGPANVSSSDYIFGAVEGGNIVPTYTGAISSRILDSTNAVNYGDAISNSTGTVNATATIGVAQNWTAIVVTYTSVQSSITLNGTGDPRLLVNGS